MRSGMMLPMADPDLRQAIVEHAGRQRADDPPSCVVALVGRTSLRVLCAATW